MPCISFGTRHISRAEELLHGTRGQQRDSAGLKDRGGGEDTGDKVEKQERKDGESRFLTLSSSQGVRPQGAWGPRTAGYLQGPDPGTVGGRLQVPGHCGCARKQSCRQDITGMRKKATNTRHVSSSTALGGWRAAEGQGRRERHPRMSPHLGLKLSTGVAMWGS